MKQEILVTSDKIWFPFSPYLLYFIFSLISFSVCYSSVFWFTSKPFALIFSFSMLFISVFFILLQTMFSILYKILVVGPHFTMKSDRPLLLTTESLFVLYISISILITTSSSIIYFYGFTQFVSAHKKNMNIILFHLPHFTALTFLLVLAACLGPVIYDCTLIYMDSLCPVLLVFIISSFLYLFFWIILWLLFTVKSSWQFRIKTALGKQSLPKAKSVKILHEICLKENPSPVGG